MLIHDSGTGVTRVKNEMIVTTRIPMIMDPRIFFIIRIPVSNIPAIASNLSISLIDSVTDPSAVWRIRLLPAAVRIFAAAVQPADASGEAALTKRRVAEKLGVEA